MTTIDLYKKHKAGEVSREKFLYEVRRDAQLPWIISVTSYDDAIKILKNKGIIRESIEETKAEETYAPETPVDEKLNPMSDEDIEIYVDELGEDVDKKVLGKFFAENNLYEREEVQKAMLQSRRNFILKSGAGFAALPLASILGRDGFT
jgi:hypothetical protein